MALFRIKVWFHPDFMIACSISPLGVVWVGEIFLGDDVHQSVVVVVDGNDSLETLVKACKDNLINKVQVEYVHLQVRIFKWHSGHLLDSWLNHYGKIKKCTYLFSVLSCPSTARHTTGTQTCYPLGWAGFPPVT